MEHFLEEYWELVTDPAHVFLEITFILVVDVILLGFAYPFFKRWMNNRIAREHEIIDEEHGVEHDEDTGEVVANNICVIHPDENGVIHLTPEQAEILTRVLEKELAL